MFLDYLYATPNLSAGIDEVIVTTQASVPAFIPMLLFFIWAVVFLAGVTSQKLRTGTSDFPMWATISSMSTIMISLPLTLTAGLIQLETLVIVVVITIFSGFWLFLDRNRSEAY